MKLSQLSAVAVALSQASLVLGRAMELPNSDLDIFNATEAEWGQFFDSLMWLDNDDNEYSPAAGVKVPGSNFFTYCEGDHDEDLIQIGKVDLDPPSPVKGEQLKVTAEAEITDEIVKGTTALVSVRMGRIRIWHKKFDMCKELGKIAGGCPLKPSKPSLEKSWGIPKKLPGGHYTVTADLKGPKDEPVTCIEGTFKI